VLESDHEQPLAAEAQGRRERRVDAEAAVEVVALADAHRGEEERDGGRGAYVERGEFGGLRAGVRVELPGVRVRKRAFHEDVDAAGAHLRARDTERAGRAAVQVGAQVVPGDALRDEALEGGDVYEAADHLGAGA
jgi:hypothetical protein